MKRKYRHLVALQTTTSEPESLNSYKPHQRQVLSPLVRGTDTAAPTRLPAAFSLSELFICAIFIPSLYLPRCNKRSETIFMSLKVKSLLSYAQRVSKFGAGRGEVFRD